MKRFERETLQSESVTYDNCAQGLDGEGDPGWEFSILALRAAIR
jgi:hypothetical protein